MIHRIWLHLEYVINSRVIYHRTEQQHIHPCRDISIQILPARIDEQRGRCHHRLAWWNRSLSHRWKTWDFEQIQFGFSHLIEHRNQSPQWKFCTRLFLQEVVFYTYFQANGIPWCFHEKTPWRGGNKDRKEDLLALWRCVLWNPCLMQNLPSCKATIHRLHECEKTDVYQEVGTPFPPKKFPENSKMLGFNSKSTLKKDEKMTINFAQL